MQRALTPLFFSTLPIAIFGCLIPLTAVAQITPDGTTSTTVNQNGNDFTIEQGSRVGDNLFHSFDEFSVPTLGSAEFNNAVDIANIFSRVTGSNISNIDGLLSANGGANLFLINPNGIIFGENARLNLGGSFFASTADSLLFEGNRSFSASNPTAPPLLKVSIPIGLNFRDNPGEIVNRSFVQNSAGDFAGLEVAPGQNLTLVGGNINFEAGEATARGGNIELGGLSAAGTVGINEDGSLNFPEDVAQADIFFNGFADVDVRGTGGGSITINARNLNLEAGDSGISLIRTGITADSTSAEAQAGDITINATDNITVDDSFIGNQVASEAVGDAGGVTITTDSLSLTNGGRVLAGTFGQGNAGSVEITARDTITFDGEQSGGFSSGARSGVASEAVGDAGGVTITTGSLTLTNGGRVSANTSGQGNAGAVEITANDTITFDGEDSDGFASGAASQVGPEAVGDAGGVTINTGSLTLTNGGEVEVSTFGQGDAGSVEITARDAITFDGEQSGGFSSGATSLVNTGAVGNAGDVIITTGSLSLTKGGRVEVSTFGQGDAGLVEITARDAITIDGEQSGGFPSGATSLVDTPAVGNAGGVTITTGSLSLTNGGRVSATTGGQGNAGNVTVNARESITISGAITRFRSGISADALIGNGNGGDVNVFTNRLTIDDGGTIEAGNFDSLGVFAPGTGQPGNINIKANSLSLSNQASIEAATQSEIGEAANINLTLAEDLIFKNNSLISARALGNANGGNVTINADDGSIVALTNQNNDIVANAQQGNGGNINITTLAIFGLEERSSTPPNQTNDIDASSQFGLQGNISVNTPEVDPTSGLIELPEAVGDASDQISQNPCEQGVGSEFIITGKGGLPSNPNETLKNNTVRVGLVDPVSVERQEEEINLEENGIPPENPTPEAVPAMGWIFNDKGEVMLTSYKTPYTEIERSEQKPHTTCSSGI